MESIVYRMTDDLYFFKNVTIKNGRIKEKISMVGAIIMIRGVNLVCPEFGEKTVNILARCIMKVMKAEKDEEKKRFFEIVWLEVS